MTHHRSHSFGGLAIAVVLVCPLILIISMPVALGLGVNLLNIIGEWPVALLLCGPLALLVVRLVTARQPTSAEPGEEQDNRVLRVNQEEAL